MHSKLLIALLFFMPLTLLHGQPRTSTLFDTDVPQRADRELQFFAFFINQGVTSNFFPTTEFLRGQVIGRLFGRNTTMTSATESTAYVEQRLIPFFVYQPNLFNGRAILRAAFEIDWTWGDVSYGAGPNQGAAVSGHQVNIQTQNIALELIPSPGWMINIGLQRMFDTPYNPYRTTVDKLLTSGYRLNFFGTHAAGITLYREADFHRFKAGWYNFYENNIFEDDDVHMFEFQYEAHLNKLWKAALTANYVRDRGNGGGGVSILGQGLNSQLTEYNGAFRFRFGASPYKADIGWIGTHFSRNADMMTDRFFLSGYFKYNIGFVRVDRGNGFNLAADIFGFASNLRLGYRYGQTLNDNINLDLIFTSGDSDGIEDQRFTGVITGNTWAAPGGIFVNSGAYLLFPHANVVNRFTPVVSDLSNMGYGLTAAVANFNRGVIPNRFNVKASAAAALSNATPIGGGRFIGTEVNGALMYNLGPFMSIELHAAHMWLGNFFDSADSRFSAPVNGGIQGVRPRNPWTAFVVFKWLLF